MKESRSVKGVWVGLAVASLLWFIMFSSWTSPYVNFWYTMAFSGILLTAIAIFFGKEWLKEIHFNFRSLLWGIVIATALWFLFLICDKLSFLFFSFAASGVDSIYAMKRGENHYVIAALLLFIIGPAEEIFWRGFVQRKFSQRWGANIGFAAALLCYSLIHIWSLNFMLIMAAMVAGFCWGLIYRLYPRSLTALIVSHAIWDLCAFIVFPIH